MKLKLLGISSFGLLLLSTSLVDARTLTSNSDWAVKKVNAETPYCTLARPYENNVTFTIAKNSNGEGTLALDFGRDAFDLTRPYPVKLSVGSIAREYAVTAASASIIIMRVGADTLLFNALRQSPVATMMIDNESFDISLTDKKGGFTNFNDCLGAQPAPAKPIMVETKKVIAPNPDLVPIPNSMPVPVRTAELTNQNNQIDALLSENRRLTSLLSQRAAQPTIQQNTGQSLAEVGQLRQQLKRAEQENLNLIAQINQLEDDLIKSRQSIDPDISATLSERNRQISLLSEQNKSLLSALQMAETNQPIVKEVLRQVEVPVASPELLTENARIKSQINILNSQLASVVAERDNFKLQMQQQSQSPKVITNEVVKEVPQVPKEMLQQQQAMQLRISQLENQAQQLSSEKASLENQLASSPSPEVIIKEVIKEVPVMSGAAPSNASEMSIQLAEAETQAKSFEAERDEYRRLLQTERRRMREEGDLAGQIKDVAGAEGVLINDVRRLEKEKADLTRQLEYAKKTGTVIEQVSAPAEVDSSKLTDLSQQLSEAKKQLSIAEAEKAKLNKRMAMIDSEAMAAQRQLAESKIAKLANDSPQAIADELNAKTLRAEIAALEAQNNVLRVDMMSDRQEKREIASAADYSQKPSAPTGKTSTEIMDQTAASVEATTTIDKPVIGEGRISRPIDDEIEATILSKRQPVQRAVPVINEKMAMVSAPRTNVVSEPIDVVARASVPTRPMAQQVRPQQPQSTMNLQPQMAALSGGEIRQLVGQSKIPLQSSIDRIDRVSGPDFAAFRWDTGMVYGSGEQSRLSDVSAFNKSVQQYIQKTASRCQGSFDQNIQTVNTANGLTASSADIACVDNNADGNAASILFFAHNGMFYALAHEADMDTFKVAMDMRDRLVGSIGQIF